MKADAMGSGTMGSAATARSVVVWDPLVRIFHWSLVASFAVAWLSAEETRDLHEWAGYAAAALIGLRVVMGVAGSRYARFGQFVRQPGEIASYAVDIVRNREARYVGHNPLGGLMVLALLAMMAALAFTGWLQTTDAYWGVEWVEETHEALANVMLAMVLLHVAGVILASYRHGENLVRAMLTGRKRAPAADDIA
jgi:cytochrome b